MNIKKLYNILPYCLLLILLITVLSCEKYKDDRYDFSDKVDPYVLFSGDDQIQAYEGIDTAIYISMKLPISLAEDVKVTYKLEGDAVINQDYTIENTSEAIIKFDAKITNVDEAFLKIYPLDDKLTDGYKSLTIKIISAFTDSSNRYLNIGENNEGATFTITLNDNDCPSSLQGEYESYAIFGIDTTYEDVSVTLVDTNEYYFTDITAGAFNNYSPPNVPIHATVNYACGDIVIKDIINIYDILSFIDISGQEELTDSTFNISWIYVDDLGNVYDKSTTHFTRK